MLVAVRLSFVTLPAQALGISTSTADNDWAYARCWLRLEMDPGHQMAISLTMVTVAFLTALPNLDGLVACRCLLTLCDDIGKELLRSHDSTDSAVDSLPDDN
jgi:hypothetical protein